MHVRLLAAVLGLAMLSGLASQALAQQTGPISEGESTECASYEKMDEMMDDMAMGDEMMEEAMMGDSMMEDAMAQCPTAEPVT